ncbi:serine O-acetyltransferase [Knoellia sinensis]|uniref:serine O-acetyltransferase n=1 Tax=Knoellia sinensis TaxID=136100 RepID=UPI000A41A00A|nr:hypothetical protein [Knoellia sinensis]
MKARLRKAQVLINLLRLWPHLLVAQQHRRASAVWADVARWCEELTLQITGNYALAYLLTVHPEFRNLFYSRVGPIGLLLNMWCRRMATLYIATPPDRIGPGLFIQHGFATIIAAESIGANCWINQQVTIGYSSRTDCPVIQDNVVIAAGAKVIGSVTVGHDAVIGANAVVVKDVDPDCTVVGVPARVVRRGRTRETGR